MLSRGGTRRADQRSQVRPPWAPVDSPYRRSPSIQINRQEELRRRYRRSQYNSVPHSDLGDRTHRYVYSSTGTRSLVVRVGFSNQSAWIHRRAAVSAALSLSSSTDCVRLDARGSSRIGV